MLLRQPLTGPNNNSNNINGPSNRAKDNDRPNPLHGKVEVDNRVEVNVNSNKARPGLEETSACHVEMRTRATTSVPHILRGVSTAKMWDTSRQRGERRTAFYVQLF